MDQEASYNAPRIAVVGEIMTVQQFEELALNIGLAALIGFMMFIIYDLGKRSKAGKFGMSVLFFALGLGMLGFIIKGVLKVTMGI